MMFEPGRRVSDAARRASDAVNLALLADRAGNVGRWVAIRLSDGGTDGVVYDRPEHAAHAQIHHQLCMYVEIRSGGMPPAEAESALAYHRMVYDAGNRPPYLDGFVPIIPSTVEGIRDRTNHRRHHVGRPARH